MKWFDGLTLLNKPVLKYAYISGAIAATILISFIIFSPALSHPQPLAIGDTAEKTLYAPRTIHLNFRTSGSLDASFQSQNKSFRLPKTIINPEINTHVLENIEGFYKILITHKLSHTSEKTELQKQIGFLNKRHFEELLSLSIEDLQSIEQLTFQVTHMLLTRPLSHISSTDIKTVILSLSPPDKAEKVTSLILPIILHFLLPNTLSDQIELVSKEPLTLRLNKGAPIIVKNELVTQSHIDIFTALKMPWNGRLTVYFMGIFCLVSLLSVLLERFIYYFSPKIYRQPKYFILCYLIVLIILCIARALYNCHFVDASIFYEFLIPISISTMILSLLVTPNISMLIGTIISILIAVMFNADISLFSYLFLSNCFTTFIVFKKYKRIELIKSGYIIGLVNIGLVIVIGFLIDPGDPMWYLYNIIIAGFSGIFSSMITLAIAPYFESLFNITTSQSLLEQASLNHPLLKRLMMTAPGTYQHSLMVANLAEAAAEAVHADVILARIGAYFHDIGKIKRPSFYTENQFSGENPHDGLTPRMSKIIIATHPKDGVELAEKYKLPEILKDFMLEHHGTSLVSFFYSRAVQSEKLKDEKGQKEAFRYPGPKPHFKESGILMLADSVEAAVRSMDKPTFAKIETLVDKIFKDRLDDNQLDHCPLSLRELQTIKGTFLRLFKGIYHTRIDYKEELNQLIKKTEENQA